MKTALILTATINPDGMSFTPRSDPRVRMGDYCKALSLWLDKQDTLTDIVICENSGYPLDELQSMASGIHDGKKVRILQFLGNDYDRSLGKGYGEARIIGHLLQNLQDIATYDYLIKCTGRYFVSNAESVLHCLEEGPDLVSWIPQGDWEYLDSRFFAARPALLGKMMDGFTEKLNDSKGMYFEHALARAFGERVQAGAHWLPFSMPPYILGISGTDNTAYNGIPAFVKHLLKVVVYKAYKEGAIRKHFSRW